MKCIIGQIMKTSNINVFVGVRFERHFNNKVSFMAGLFQDLRTYSIALNKKRKAISGNKDQ